jgi:hypothetical protein
MTILSHTILLYMTIWELIFSGGNLGDWFSYRFSLIFKFFEKFDG